MSEGIITCWLTYDVYTRKKNELSRIGHVRRSPTDSVVGQVMGDVVARRSRSNDNDLPPNVFLGSRVFEGMDNLALKLFL
jgi:hypothetical protein